MIGIYKITNPNKKVYIGQSINIENRFYQYNIITNCKSQIALFNSLKKYGPALHTFEILEECNVDELNFKERYYQDYYNVLGENGLNCRLTTTKDKSGRNTLESNIKRSETLKGVKRGPRPDVVEKNKIVHKGKTISDAHKEAISKYFKGKPHPYQGPRGVTLRMPVLQYSKDRKVLLNEYISISEAAKAVGRGGGDIHRVISGKGVSCAGFWWMYKV
jgi:group I intron endonuclease